MQVFESKRKKRTHAPARTPIPSQKPKKQKITWDYLVAVGKVTYENYGAAYTLWWFLKTVNKPVRFKYLFKFHKDVAGVKSKNATLNALDTLRKYGLVKNENGFYQVTPGIDESFVLSCIDLKRVRTRDQIVKNPSSCETSEEDVSRALEKTIEIAKNLISEGEKWKAVDLLAHTLIGVRGTGVLIARLGDLFIYYEPKDGKMHMFSSDKVAKIFEELGIKDKILTKHADMRNHAKNQIHKLFKSHPIARRLHYELKEKGWFTYFPEEEKFLFEFSPEQDYPFPFASCDYRTLMIYRIGDKGLEPYKFLEGLEFDEETKKRLKRKGAVVTREHVKEENEETYFSRPAGIF